MSDWRGHKLPAGGADAPSPVVFIFMLSLLLFTMGCLMEDRVFMLLLNVLVFSVGFMVDNDLFTLMESIINF